MTSDFSGELSAIRDDFCEELTGIREFSNPGGESSGRLVSARARVAAANGATLLLAALCEEFISQVVKAIFNWRRATEYGQRKFPEKLPAAVWRRSLEMLARKPFDDLVSNGSQTDLQLRDVVSFCIRGNLGADVGSAVSHNDNNMRPEELGRLFNQVGVGGIVAKLGEHSSVRAYFGIENSGQAADKIRATMEGFFGRRNEIAHAIQIGASGGPASLANDVEFFEVISDALVAILAAEIASDRPRTRRTRSNQP